MENNLKFNSAICTSIEQSERLLSLGLKKETADMNYTRLSKEDHWTLFIGLPMGYDEIPNEYLLPAWSLHRLIEMVAETWFEYMLFLPDVYDDVITEIENAIKNGWFNKEYLV